jgi:hypothetical protein
LFRWSNAIVQALKGAVNLSVQLLDGRAPHRIRDAGGVILDVVTERFFAISVLL